LLRIGKIVYKLILLIMKTKELLKRALKHPELFTSAELQYFKLMKKYKKRNKKDKKKPESDYLL